MCSFLCEGQAQRSSTTGPEMAARSCLVINSLAMETESMNLYAKGRYRLELKTCSLARMLDFKVFQWRGEDLKKNFRTQKHQADVFGVGTDYFRDRG